MSSWAFQELFLVIVPPHQEDSEEIPKVIG